MDIKEMQMTRIITAAAVITLLATSPVLADCRAQDMGGWWRLTGIGIIPDDSGDFGRIPIDIVSLDCRLHITRNGDVDRLRCFHRDPASWVIAEGEGDWTNFSDVQVGRNCWMKLNLDNAGDGIWFDGHVTPNKEAAAGIGFAYDDPIHFTFDMIRQSR